MASFYNCSLDYCDGNDSVDARIRVENGRAFLLMGTPLKAISIRDWSSGLERDALSKRALNSAGEYRPLYLRWDEKSATFFSRPGDRFVGWPEYESDAGALVYPLKGGDPDPSDYIPMMLTWT